MIVNSDFFEETYFDLLNLDLFHSYFVLGLKKVSFRRDF